MITAISEIARFESLFSNLRTNFNATLPISLKVLKEVDLNRFILQMGKREVETKSLIPLKEGEIYWGEFKTSKGVVQISNLLQKPSFEKKKEIFSENLFFDLKDLEEIFSDSKASLKFKENILNKMSISSNREDFAQLGNMLLAFENGVFFIPLKIEDRRYFFQFKNKQKKDKVKKEFTTFFYASFENLGPVRGVIEVGENYRRLRLYTYFEKSADFLKKEMKNLDMQSEIFVSKNIEALFNLENRLLDIKG